MRRAPFSLFFVTLAVLAFVALFGCDVSSALTAAGTQIAQTETASAKGTWALPYPPGTHVKLGSCRLHGDNFGSAPNNSSGTPPVFHFDSGLSTPVANNCGNGDSALDLLLNDAGAPITALAPGRVISVWAQCHLVLIDHQNGWWVIYLHVMGPASDPKTLPVSPGMDVTTNTILGYPIPFATPDSTCHETSDAPHVHFAFLKPAQDQTGRINASYVTMTGMVLCGYTVQSDGTLMDANTGNVLDIGTPFPVPQCP